jgi:oxaloacetate decarboxylase alpha subunit
MRAAGPVRRDYPLGTRELDEVRALLALSRTPYLHVSTDRFDLELRR